MMKPVSIETRAPSLGAPVSRLHTVLGVCALCAVLSVLTHASIAQGAPADASPRDLLICHVSDMGNAKEAKPYLDAFTAYLSGKLGWDPSSVVARFETKRKKALAAVRKQPPSYATLPLGLFLELRVETGMRPLVLAKADGSTEERYRVLTKKGQAASLAELAGKRLTGDQVDDHAFLGRVIFAGALPAGSSAETYFQLKRAKRPLRAIRKVARGKADAVLVSDRQYESLKSLPLFADLQVVFESAPLPRLGLVWLDGRGSEADARALAEALVAMCDDPKGASICETFSVEGFAPVPKGHFDAVIKRYGAQ